MSHVTIDELFNAGAHFGYSKTKRHPSVVKQLFGNKNRVDLIDLEKTVAQIDAVATLIREYAAKGKVMLLVGTKPEARSIIEAIATETSMPYVIHRWVGGTFTNWPEIKKRIARLTDLEDKREKGELEKYTKKERLLIDREIAKMSFMFAGLQTMKKLPDIVVVIDPKKEHLAVEEAKCLNIPVVGLMSSDNDMKFIEHPVLANDSSQSSIRLFARIISEAYRAGVSGGVNA